MIKTHANNYLRYVFIFNSLAAFSQENTTQIDTIDTVASEEKHKFELNLDLASRYIWRGQSWGGDYPVVQPAVNYFCNDKLTLGIWATTNFKKDYYYPDGVTATKGYQEVDFSISYKFNKYLTIQIWDYYWPAVKKIEGIDNSFFNYGNDGVKTVDATLLFDFSEFKVPITANVSTLVAGNDYRYDNDGENPKQNFTTYLELAYTWENVWKKIELYPFAGAVLNNQAAYYFAGDYDKVSLINVGIKASREFDLGHGVTIPVSLNYIYNAAAENNETFGRNFLVAGVTYNCLVLKERQKLKRK